MVYTRHAPRSRDGRFEPVNQPNDPGPVERTLRDRTQSVPPPRRRVIQDGEGSGLETHSYLEPSEEEEASVEELLDSVRKGKRRERGPSLHRSRGDSEVARRPRPDIENDSLEVPTVNFPDNEESEVAQASHASLAAQLAEAQSAIRRLEVAAGVRVAGPSGQSTLPIRGPDLRPGTERASTGPRVTADPLGTKSNYPIRNTSVRETPTVSFNDTGSIASSGQTRTKRRRNLSTGSSSSSSRHYRGMRPRNVSVYGARTARAHLEWIRECESIFRIMKREYRSEGSRIRYAVQWLPFDKMDI